MESSTSDSVDIFFALLRSGLYGTPIPEAELPESIDWKPVLALAKKQTVIGIIIESVQLLPERLRPAPATMQKMGKFATGLIRTHAVLDRSVARLVTGLERHDIQGVLLKGQGVARYYRNSLMRHTGDIDFYVGRQQFKKAADVCRREFNVDVESDHDSSQHCTFSLNGIPVEIHRLATRLFSPFGNKEFQRWIVGELEQSPSRRKMKIADAEITLPSYNFDAIFIFYHAWRHYLEGGIGLRQVCDWVMVLYSHYGDIDTEALTSTIKRFGLTAPWKLFACIAVDHLGLSAERIPLYDPRYSKKSEKLLSEILAGGNFGYYSDDYLKYKGYGFVGLRYGLEKITAYTKSFLTLFPVIPAEASFLYLSRLFSGPISLFKRMKGK